MRLLILTDEIYPDAIGGIGKSVFNEVTAFVRLGHDVTVLVRATNPDLPSYETLDGFKVFRLRGPSRASRVYHFYPLWILVTVARWLRSSPREFDAAIAYNPLYVLAAALTALLKRMPVVYVFFSFMSTEIQVSGHRGKYGKAAPAASVVAALLLHLEKWAYSRVQVILPRSSYSRDVLLRNYRGKNVIDSDNIIPLGLDLDHYAAMSHREARKQLEFPETDPILITVRRLEGRMGLLNLISAMAIVCAKYPNAVLLIGGQGYLRNALEAAATQLSLEANIQFLGFVEEARLPAYLAAADLFVLPSETLEGFGLATIEALACSTPVLGTPVGATPEILLSLDPALLTRDASPDAIADGILFWLDHAEELADLRQSSRLLVESNFDSNQIAHRLLKLITMTTS